MIPIWTNLAVNEHIGLWQILVLHPVLTKAIQHSGCGTKGAMMWYQGVATCILASTDRGIGSTIPLHPAMKGSLCQANEKASGIMFWRRSLCQITAWYHRLTVLVRHYMVAEAKSDGLA